MCYKMEICAVGVVLAKSSIRWLRMDMRTHAHAHTLFDIDGENQFT